MSNMHARSVWASAAPKVDVGSSLRNKRRLLCPTDEEWEKQITRAMNHTIHLAHEDAEVHEDEEGEEEGEHEGEHEDSKEDEGEEEHEGGSNQLKVEAMDLSTTLGGYPASNCNDGNLQNFCHSAQVGGQCRENGPWLTMELGGTKLVSSVRIYNRPSSGDYIRFGAHDIELSNDKQTWHTCFTGTLPASYGPFDESCTGTGRFVRLRMTHTDCLNLAEVPVFGSEGEHETEEEDEGTGRGEHEDQGEETDDEDENKDSDNEEEDDGGKYDFDDDGGYGGGEDDDGGKYDDLSYEHYGYSDDDSNSYADDDDDYSGSGSGEYESNYGGGCDEDDDYESRGGDDSNKHNGGYDNGGYDNGGYDDDWMSYKGGGGHDDDDYDRR